MVFARREAEFPGEVTFPLPAREVRVKMNGRGFMEKGEKACCQRTL